MNEFETIMLQALQFTGTGFVIPLLLIGSWCAYNTGVKMKKKYYKAKEVMNRK